MENNSFFEQNLKLLKKIKTEMIPKYRSETETAIREREEIWEDAFTASEVMYHLGFIIERDFVKYFDQMNNERKREIDSTFWVLNLMLARSYQIFLEILTLMKAGFADGALARWRTLYELSIYAGFIRQNGEKVALAYFQAAGENDINHKWANNAESFHIKRYKKGVPFCEIQDQCKFATSDKREKYKSACSFIHASPEGTLVRLGVITPINAGIAGPTDYGFLDPGIYSAKALADMVEIIAKIFTEGDRIFSRQIGLMWECANTAVKCYEEAQNYYSEKFIGVWGREFDGTEREFYNSQER